MILHPIPMNFEEIFPCRVVIPARLVGRYDNPMPELILSPHSGSMNSATALHFLEAKSFNANICVTSTSHEILRHECYLTTKQLFFLAVLYSMLGDMIKISRLLDVSWAAWS